MSSSDDDEYSLLEIDSPISCTSETTPCNSKEDSDWENDSPDMSFDRVLLEEQELIRQKQMLRSASLGGTPFSLALSGGGIRAAAFQAGVLWRLAEAGCLKDVEYLTAVSGGGYVAASYASHLCSGSLPTDPSEVDRWYSDAVARTICRMQRNAGGFVRDSIQDPGVPMDGAGSCPRVCDLPLLLLVLMVTIWTNPCAFLVTVLIPITETIEIFFGPVMRGAFCDMDDTITPYGVLLEHPAFSAMSRGLFMITVVTFVIWLVSKLPFAKSRAAKVKHPMCYLFVQSTLAALLRCAFALVILLSLVVSVTYAERLKYDMFMHVPGVSPRYRICLSHMCSNATDTNVSMVEPCEGYLDRPMPWLERYNCSRTDIADIPTHKNIMRISAAMQNWDAKTGLGFLTLVGLAMVFTVIGAIVLMPCFPWLLTNVVLWLGPFVLFLVTFLLLQFRIFGPMTGQKLLDIISFDENWTTFVSFSVGAGMVLIFFSDQVHGLWHWYYKRCLQTNFFDGGFDKSWDELRNNPYCPLLVMTGTVNDFMRPTDKRSISEISFSALHTGSLKCGYVRTPPFRSLAQTTALTGAGSLDALSLSMSNKIRIRFWLEVLNLGWGDFVLFERDNPKFKICAQRAGRYAMGVYLQIHRAPTTVLWTTVCVLYAEGWLLLRRPNDANCQFGRGLLMSSIGLTITMIVLSFFSFLDCLSWLMFSPVIRRLQEASRFYFRGLRAPGMLYVTDGGVQDCTALMQLMRRRVERILLVLAASDPSDDLAVLRTTMDVALSSKVGCFYDPRDPRTDVKVLLDEFKKDLRMPYLHLGIRYGWDCPAGAESFGRLIIIKNRLPEGFEHQPVRPLLTEEEISGGQCSQEPTCDKQAWADLLEEDLGGFGCCDCCHLHCGNPGRKFPHLSFTGYMYLTPRLFNSLSRLGHAVSAPAVMAATRPGVT